MSFIWLIYCLFDFDFWYFKTDVERNLWLEMEKSLFLTRLISFLKNVVLEFILYFSVIFMEV